MGKNDEWIERIRATAQGEIAEHVIAAGIFAPAGSLGALGAGKASPLGGMFKRKASNERAGGLGYSGEFRFRQALLAVTADKVYAFNTKQKRSGFEVVDRVAEWDRRDVRVTVTEQKMTRLLVVDVASTGAHHELEMVKLAGDLNDAVLAELTRAR